MSAPLRVSRLVVLKSAAALAGLRVVPMNTIVIQYGLWINQKDVPDRAIISIGLAGSIACDSQGEKKPRRGGALVFGGSVTSVLECFDGHH